MIWMLAEVAVSLANGSFDPAPLPPAFLLVDSCQNPAGQHEVQPFTKTPDGQRIQKIG